MSRTVAFTEAFLPPVDVLRGRNTAEGRYTAEAK